MPLSEAPAPEPGRVYRCSAWSRLMSIDPIGTIGPYRGYLLMDRSLPWPQDVSGIPELAAVAAMLRGTGVRLQATVPDAGRPPAATLYLGDPARFEGYADGRTLELGPTQPLDVATRLLAGEGDAVGPGERTVLVCTHGRRDVCCGGSGTALAAELQGQLPGLRRTSHTGGHRFAPTALVLPEGTAWAYLDIDLLTRAVEHRGPVEDLLPHYRGCAGLASRQAQAVEREALRAMGWGLLERPRWSEELADGRTRLTVEQADGTRRGWEGTVAIGREVPIPDCGQPVEGSAKTERELTVSGLLTS